MFLNGKILLSLLAVLVAVAAGQTISQSAVALRPEVGAWPHRAADMPKTNGSGKFAFSHFAIQSRNTSKILVFGAGRQGIYQNRSYPAWKRDESFVLGYDITEDIEQAYRNLEQMVECTGANPRTDILFARVDWGFNGLSHKESNRSNGWPWPLKKNILNKDLSAEDIDFGFNVQYRNILNSRRRGRIPDGLFMDPRTLVISYGLVAMRPVEITWVWEMDPNVPTCADVFVYNGGLYKDF